MSLDLGLEAIVARRDFRCIGQRTVAQWAEARRQIYLIRTTVELPISIDRAVTPVALFGDRRADTIELMGVAIATTAQERKMLDQWRPASEPPPVNSEWRFLGYDVCDRVEKSGLMNCATNDAEGNDGYWTFLLNRYHLFENLADADRFRQLSDKRVSAHAPFVVVALLVHTPDVIVGQGPGLG